ncbi:GntR family transcriptional regulator [Actinoplanes sp. NPDC023714]|uniref:GntR family transcriptional regulator n=1 Tax=Actinoplanes sp. NPDC023714 TaxID=3154322 RepID=UPI0033D14373
MAIPPTPNRGADRADVAHERLREAILAAELRPNHRLVEKEIADWLVLSRTSVREALFRLVQEAWSSSARAGWSATTPRPESPANTWTTPPASSRPSASDEPRRSMNPTHRMTLRLSARTPS